MPNKKTKNLKNSKNRINNNTKDNKQILIKNPKKYSSILNYKKTITTMTTDK